MATIQQQPRDVEDDPSFWESFSSVAIRASLLLALVMLAGCSSTETANESVNVGTTVVADDFGNSASLEDLARSFAEFGPGTVGTECDRTKPVEDPVEHVAIEEWLESPLSVVVPRGTSNLTVATDLDHDEWGVPAQSSGDFVGIQFLDDPALESKRLILSKASLGGIGRKGSGVETIFVFFDVDGPSRTTVVTLDQSGEIDVLSDCSNTYGLTLNNAANELSQVASVDTELLVATLQGEDTALRQAIAESRARTLEEPPTNEIYLEPGFDSGKDGLATWINIVLPDQWLGDGSSEYSICVRSIYGAHDCVAANANVQDGAPNIYAWADGDAVIELWIDQAIGEPGGPLIRLAEISQDDISNAQRVEDGLPLLVARIESAAKSPEQLVEDLAGSPDLAATETSIVIN